MAAVLTACHTGEHCHASINVDLTLHGTVIVVAWSQDLQLHEEATAVVASLGK